MASYQDIETRLVAAEDLLLFIAKAMRMRASVPNGLLNPDGTPSYAVQDGSMLDWFRMSQQDNLTVVTQDQAEPPKETN